MFCLSICPSSWCTSVCLCTPPHRAATVTPSIKGRFKYQNPVELQHEIIPNLFTHIQVASEVGKRFDKHAKSLDRNIRGILIEEHRPQKADASFKC